MSSHPAEVCSPPTHDKLLMNFEWYCASLLKIRTKDRIVRPFDTWYPSQWHIWKSIQADIRAGRPIRKIVYKCRQTGASTLSEALAFWQAHTHPNTHALVLSMDLDSSRYIFEMARNFYECLPTDVRPMKRYSSKRELVFENPDEKTRLNNPGLRSRIEVQTAGKYVPPRGANYNFVHFSEVAFWPDAEEIIPAIIPMVPTLPETFIIYESTANGIDNFFCEEWRAAKEGASAFDPIFIPWTIMQEYSMAFHSTEEKDELIDTLDDDERQLLEELHVTYEQLNWRRYKIMEMKGDVDKFKQEYPATEEEGFLFTGDPIFDRKILNRIQPVEAKWLGDISVTKQSVVENRNGLLQIWEHPTSVDTYVCGVDVSSGTAKDYSCIEILKRTWPDGLAEQVAEWHGLVDPIQLGQLLVVIAKYYNNAMLSIEINNHGLSTQSEAQRNYWNFYRWQYFDRVGRAYTKKIGWETNVSTKPILVDRTRACLRSGLIGINSESLLWEMKHYVKRFGTMSFEAESGNDDRVMAFMIALTTLYIEDPDAAFVLEGEAQKVRLVEGAEDEDAYRNVQLGREVQVKPIWDNADPRGAAAQRQPNWRSL